MHLIVTKHLQKRIYDSEYQLNKTSASQKGSLQLRKSSLGSIALTTYFLADALLEECEVGGSCTKCTGHLKRTLKIVNK